ncbi:MAG TPA: POTRA domain-containing protein [Bacteroidota bacterium]
MTQRVNYRSAKASAENRFTGFFCCLFAFVSICPYAGARQSEGAAPKQTVRSITTHGNKTFSRSEILSWLTIREGVAFSREILEQDLHVVRTRYHSEGFLFMSLDSLSVVSESDEGGVDVSLHIREEKPAVLSSVNLSGNRSLESEALLAVMESKPGKRFRQHFIERDVQAILQQYEQSGYPFTKVSLEDVILKERESEYDVEVVLRIDEGDMVRISGLTIEGNTVTNDNVIMREARLQQNEIFTSDLPARVQQRLQRLQLFSSVSLPSLFVREDGTAGFLVRVTEGNPNRFDGVAGYVPSSRAGESGYVTGLANVQFRNLFGTGRRLSARWQRENQSTQEIELRYHEPWLASYPVNADAGFYQRKQDSSYVRRSYDLEAEFMLTEDFRLGASLAQHDVIPSEGLSAVTVSENHTTTIGGFLLFDSRDDALTPTQGLMYRMEYRTGSKKRTLSDVTTTSSTQRFGLDVEYYMPLFTRQVLGTAVHAREFRSGGIEESDMFRLGGTATLRGYREGQFLGSRIAWSNIEYRFLIAPRSFLYLFTDAAYIVSPDFSATGGAASEQTKIGFGAGLRVDTALGLLGVSIALGEGDTFGTAKLHLRLVNEF